MRTVVKVETDRAPKAVGPYSQATSGAGLVFVSGQLPLDMEGRMPDGIEDQARQSIRNMLGILEECGLTEHAVLKTTVYLRDMDDFSIVNSIYDETFGYALPARSAIGVAGLPKGAKFEIECIALGTE